jgi:hypothetical protein
MVGRWVGVALLLAGCTQGDKDTGGGLMDTGWFEDSDPTSELCRAVLHNTVPADGADGWYWHDPLTVRVGVVSDAYVVRLTTANGREVPTRLVADESGLVLSVQFDGGLAPDTEHVLEVTDCATTHEVRFTTSHYGRPVVGGPRALYPRSYELGIADASAEWVEPSGLGALFGSFFETPVLLGVQYVDETSLDLIGAIGDTELGYTSQDFNYPSWNFPATDFTGAPYFEIVSERVDLVVSGYALPIFDFRLTGTFVADGASFGGAVLQGLGDTRYSGGALGQPNNERAMCDFGEGVGVPCQACPDGEDLCLRVDVRNLVARELPGIVLRPLGGAP